MGTRAAADRDVHEAGAYRRAMCIIIALIGAIAGGQILYALVIGNRFLLKDGIDWVYDIILWGMALAVFGRGVRAERLAALGIAAIMLAAGLHTGYDLWDKIVTGRRAELWVAGWSSGTMLLVAIVVLALMVRFRKAANPLIAATWLSSRNSGINTILFAGLSFGARTQTGQAYEIALDCVGMALSFQAVYAILSPLARERDEAGTARDTIQERTG